MQGIRVNFFLWLAWTVFVVYGSLLPFDYHALTLDQAIYSFRHMPFLRLGIESRADWVANGVLYVPVGLLTTRLWLAIFRGRAVPIAMLFAITFGVVLAGAVEFAQAYFPPRTVSQNDLIAECIGTLLGALVAPWLTPWVARLRGLGSLGGRRLLLGLLEVYLVVYLLQSLFPFDLLLDSREWAAKLASNNVGWFMAGASLQRGWIAGLFLVIELFLAVPIGLLLAAWWPARRNMFGVALVLGLVVGLAIELGQLTIASGNSQGASVITRGLGAALGWWSWRLWADEGGLTAFRRGLRRVSGLLASAYLVVLGAVNGWLSHSWTDLASALQLWPKQHLMPFYYHYFSTEADAVFSLGSVVLMYLPVVVIGWARRWTPVAVVGVAVCLSLVIEASKLFLVGLHPDASNPLIVLAACSIAMWLLAILQRPVTPGHMNAGSSKGQTATGAGLAVSGRPPHDRAGETALKTALAIVAMAALALTLVWFPALRWLVVAVLLVSAGVVWFRPAMALALVPAALPVLDLAPWTGRFYWGAFDLLLLVVVVVGWLRTTSVPSRTGAGPARILTMTLWLIGISLAVSAARGMLPWQWPDANSFNHYYSGFNALRIAKGALWALAFAALYRRIDLPGMGKFRVFAWGMGLGLMATVAVILWERMAFVGLFDFDADYRVTGPFSAMHTGGAYIECYLALASAFLIWLVLHTPGIVARAMGVLLLALTTYAMMVTYSRNGYGALLVVAIVMGASTLVGPADPGSGPTWRRRTVALALVAVMVVAAVPVLRGTFAQQRLDQVQTDFSTRLAHWRDALYMRDDNWATAIFGMGLGRFPVTHYWRSAEPVKAASYGLVNGKDGSFLRLGTGSQVYVEQLVDVVPGQRYRLSLNLRSTAPARLGVALCEKWMLTSASCQLELIDANGTPTQWQKVEATLSTQSWEVRPLPITRPVKFSLFSSAGPGVIEVSDLRLETEDGTAVVQNGNFSQGLDRWFFSADVDPPWHIHSLPATVLFDQGWLGLLALVGVWAAAVSLAFARTMRGDPVAPPLLAAMLAFTVSGLFNTLIDAPRFLMLILFLVWLCSQSWRLQVRQPSVSGAAAK